MCTTDAGVASWVCEVAADLVVREAGALIPRELFETGEVSQVSSWTFLTTFLLVCAWLSCAEDAI